MCLLFGLVFFISAQKAACTLLVKLNAGFLYLIYYVSTEGLTRLQNDYNCTQTEKQSENE
jgi:hypothetical protein